MLDIPIKKYAQKFYIKFEYSSVVGAYVLWHRFVVAGAGRIPSTK